MRIQPLGVSGTSLGRITVMHSSIRIVGGGGAAKCAPDGIAGR